MSSFSGGGFFGHSRSSGHKRRGQGMGGFLGGSHSSHGKGRYVQGGHYRPVAPRRSGCLGFFMLGVLTVGSGVMGLVSLLG